MRVGISSASMYPQQPTEAAIVNIAAMGCPLVEVFLQTRREYQSHYVQQLARLTNRLGIKVHSVHAASSQFEPMLFYNYRRQNLDGRDLLKQVLESAAILGASCYTFHGPLRIANLDREPLLEGLVWVAELAKEWGVKLALENVSWCAGWNPSIFSWLNENNIPNLYYTLDSKQALRSGFEVNDYLDAMAERLVTVHLSDRGGVPGEDMDFSPMANKLQEIAYTGPIMLETYGTRVESAKHLNIGYKQLKKFF